MIETKFESMQSQAPERIGPTVYPITSVSDQRMPQILHVYTYLILTSGFQSQFYQRVAIGTFVGAIVGDRFGTAIRY